MRVAMPVMPDGRRLAVIDTESLPEIHVDPELALGRRLFFDTTDPRISTAGLSCVSCHPDGRQDGVVWRLNGSRRQTMLLAGRLAGTAPYNWKGTTKTLEENIAQTTQRLGGTGLAKAEQHALARFLVEGLRPVTLPEATDSALVERGKQLFNDEAVGCASCHPSDGAFTDGQNHDVESVRKAEVEELVAHAARLQSDVTGTASVSNVFGPSGINTLGGFGGLGLSGGGLGTGIGRITTAPPKKAKHHSTAMRIPIRIVATPVPPSLVSKPEPVGDPNDHSFDTPSLRGLAVSAPYMHDGVYPTLEKLLEENHDRMGTTSELSPEEIAALAAYLRTL
jgi:cytochrome c peroxidase